MPVVVHITSSTEGGGFYAPGDVGILEAGNFDATYQVLTVDPVFGAVLTIALTGAGSLYPTSQYRVFTAATTGIGGALFVDILAIAGGVTAIEITDVNAGFGFQIGDTGTFYGGPNLIPAGTCLYTVQTVNAFGRVLTLTVAGGVGYASGCDYASTIITGTGTALLCQGIAAAGSLTSAITQPNFPGANYQPGDTGLIVNPGGPPNTATYQVLTIDPIYGGVTAVSVGNLAGYPTNIGNNTLVVTGIGDLLLALDLFVPASGPGGRFIGSHVGFMLAGQFSGGTK
jgi:hypothetical protein